MTFVVAVNDRHIFEHNFRASPCVHSEHGHELLIQQGFTSAPKAYNDALRRSSNDLVVFCHQDVYLPERWLSDLGRALDYLALHDPTWGVVGCSGITREHQHWRFLYSSGLGVSGAPFEYPRQVQTLDEIVLVIRRSSGLRFDERLPSYHLYGTDICLSASRQGMNNYAISAFCIHNTCQLLVLPPDFYRCCEYIKRNWADCLPIQTTCVRITRLSLSLYARRLRETYLRYIRRRSCGAARRNDVSRIVAECADAALRGSREQIP